VSTIQKSQVERRRSVRISPKGTVILFAGEHVEHGRIANLSGGGLLATTDGSPPEALLDARVDLELRLDAATSEWLRLTGRVTRVGAHEIALALEPSEPFVQLMEGSSSASGEHRRVRAVVLVDATPERRATIANGFRAAGCAVLEVSTPLEAIVRLGESQFEPDLIAIADSLPSSTSDDLRRFVEREHPHAKLVTVGDDLLEPPGLTHWLSSENPRDDLVARIQDLLDR
jgi:hypothetical protein